MSKLGDVFGRMKFVMDHHPVIGWMDPLARKLGVVKFLHVVWDVLDKDAHEASSEKFQTFYASHGEDIQRLSEMLEDDFSRYTLKKVLEFRKSFDRSVLKDVNVQPQYFQKDIFGPVEDEVFVDGGAYTGDTIESFITAFAGGYKRIYAWEPDESNLKRLKKNTEKLQNIVYVPCGMWKEKTVLRFAGDGGAGAKVTEDANANILEIDADNIDNVCSQDKVTFIKMDIEGSELAALEGAVNVIKRDKPRLAICIYHKPEDLYEIPFWIKETVPEYKLYMRHHSDRLFETVIYATL